MSTNTPSPATDTAPAPDVAAATAPESWADKIARLRARKPAETFLTVPDVDALQAVDTARQEYLEQRRLARKELPDAGSLTADEIDAFLSGHKAVKAAHARLEDAVTAAEDAEVTFHFRALPPDVYDKFQLDHPPTEEQESRDMVYNPDTYVPALVAASSVQPLTPGDVVGLITPQTDPDHPDRLQPPVFNQGDVHAFVQAIRDLNERPRMILGKGSRPTPD